MKRKIIRILCVSTTVQSQTELYTSKPNAGTTVLRIALQNMKQKFLSEYIP